MNIFLILMVKDTVYAKTALVKLQMKKKNFYAVKSKQFFNCFWCNNRRPMWEATTL